MSKAKDEMITIAEASRRSGIPVRTLRNAANKGYLKAKKEKTARGDIYWTTEKDVQDYKVWKYTPRPKIKNL